MKNQSIKAKKLIQEKNIPYVYMDLDVFQGSIEEVIEKIKNIKTRFQEDYSTMEKSFPSHKFTPFEDLKRIEIGFEHDYDGILNITLSAFREETDEEFARRLKKEEEHILRGKKAAQTKKEANIKREKALLETLKKKYES